MVARKKKTELKKFSISVEREHWMRARRNCNNGKQRTVGAGCNTRSGLAFNCVIADALIDFLGDDVPLRTRYDGTFIDVEVGFPDAVIGGKHFKHDGGPIIDAFDNGLRPSKAGLVFPLTVNFTRR